MLHLTDGGSIKYATCLPAQLPDGGFIKYAACLPAQLDQGTAKLHEFLGSGVPGVTVSRMYLTEAAQRRLSRLPLSDDEDRTF